MIYIENNLSNIQKRMEFHHEIFKQAFFLQYIYILIILNLWLTRY